VTVKKRNYGSKNYGKRQMDRPHIPPNSQNEVMAFVSLWEAVKDIQLNNAVDDEIK
jgi:hypothetical protein